MYLDRMVKRDSLVLNAHATDVPEPLEHVLVDKLGVLVRGEEKLVEVDSRRVLQKSQCRRT